MHIILSVSARQSSEAAYEQGDAGGACSSAYWLTAEWLPKYAPELNDIEGVRGALKAHHLAHQTFVYAHTRSIAIHDSVTALNSKQNHDPLVIFRPELIRVFLSSIYRCIREA